MGVIGSRHNLILANYFFTQPHFVDGDRQTIPNIRKCTELPFQQIKARQWYELAKILCDVFFLEVRAKAFLLDLQQFDYNDALLHMPESGNKRCITDFYWIFMHYKHFLKDHPELCFQQFYNQLQWKKDQTKKIIEDAKDKFLLRGGRFLHQYAQPEFLKSNLIMTLSDHRSEVNYCAFSKNTMQIISGSRNGTLKIWDAVTGKMIRTLNLLPTDWEKEYDFTINSWAFSVDEKQIATGSLDGTLKVWNANTGSEICSLESDTVVGSCAYFPDDNLILACGWGLIELWETHNKKILKKYRIPRKLHSSCKFSPDGKYILAGYSTVINIWEITSGNLVMSLNGHKNEIVACGFSSDGKYIISFSSEAFILWNTEIGTEVWNNPGDYGFVCCCAFSSDNQMIAFGGEDNCINIWNIRSKEEVVILKGHSGTINSCSFSADDKQIISASSDETIKIWNLIPLSDSLTLAAHTSAITSSSFSPDGDQVVSTGKWDRNIKIWNTNKGETRAKLIGPKRSSIKSCAFSPDGKQIVSAHGYIIALWDIVSGNKIRYLRCGKGIFVNSCAFSPDGGKLVSGSVEGLIIIWDLNTGTQSMILSEGSDFLLEKCEFSPDGKYIISKGGKSINIWSLDSGNLAISISRNFLLFMLKEIFPDDKYFITGKRKTLALIDYQQTDEFLSLYGGNCILTNSCYIYNFVNYLKICDSVTLVEISKFYFEGFCNSFSVSPDGTIIACGDNIGNFYLLKLTGFSIGKPIDLSVKFFELLADLRLKISQGGWRNLSNKENLWNDEFEEERYEVEILNGEWKKIEDFKPF